MKPEGTYTHVTIKDIDLPITKCSREFWGYKTFLNEKLVPSNIHENIVYSTIETDFTYKYKFYYDLFDIKGNKIKEDYHSFTDDVDESELLDGVTQNRVSDRIVIFYLDGDFRILVIPSDLGMSRQEDIGVLQDFLSEYYDGVCSYTNRKIRMLDSDLKYDVFHGHSRSIKHVITEQDLSMTYKDLLSKKENILELAKKHNLHDRFSEEWCDDSINNFVRSICDFLGLTERQYKRGNYKVEHRLITKFNNKINEKVRL